MTDRQHHGNIAFRQGSRPAVIVEAVSGTWIILDANDAYAAVTCQAREALIGRPIFEALLENEETTRNGAALAIRRSLEDVLSHRKPVVLPVQRYDLASATAGVYDMRHWEPSSAPLLADDGALVGILHEVTDVTERVQAAIEHRALTDELLVRNMELQENAVEMEAQAEELHATAAQLEERTEEAESARNAAQLAEQRVIDVFKQAPAFIAVLNGPDYVFEFANDAYHELVGHRAALGKPLLEALPELRGQGFIELLDGVRASGIAYEGREVPVALVSAPGGAPELHYVNFIYAPIRDGALAISRILAHGVDVTAQVRARESIIASEEQLRTLADAIPTLAWTARGDGFIDWYNARWYEYTGTTPAEMEGWGWQSVHDANVLPHVMEEWTSAIRSGQPFEMTFPLRGADGRFRQFLTRVLPSFDDNGTVVRWFGTNTDVDVERRARQDAEESESRVLKLQSLTASLAAAQSFEEVATVLMTDLIGVTGAHVGAVALMEESGEAANIILDVGLPRAILAANARISVRDGIGPSSEVLRTGRPLFINALDGPDGLLARYPAFADSIRALGTHATATMPLAVGSRMLGVLSLGFAAPQSDADRAFIIALAQQASQALERARLFAAEQGARATAEEANMAKMNFLATMSHELRTPLNAMGGYLDLLLLGLRGPISDVQHRDLERMKRSQARLLNLINDILNYARIDTGHVHFDIRPVRASRVIRHVEELVAAQSPSSQLTTEVRVEEPTPIVLADEERLGQILLNLWSNAIKYTPRGGAVSVRAGTDGDVVRIEVRDTGIGIPEDKLTSIFDPFMQVGRRLNTPGEGVGLGLAIAKDLAAGMGGSLTVVSRVGVGSTFTLTLPAAPGP